MTCILLCMHYEPWISLTGTCMVFWSTGVCVLVQDPKVVGGQAVRDHFYRRQLADCGTFMCYHQLHRTAMYLAHSTLNYRKNGRRKRERVI